MARSLLIKLSGLLLIAGSLTGIFVFLPEQIKMDLGPEFGRALMLVFGSLMYALGWLGILFSFWQRLGRSPAILTVISIGLLILIARAGYLSLPPTSDIKIIEAYALEASFFTFARYYFTIWLGIGLYDMFRHRLPKTRPRAMSRGLRVAMLWAIIIAILSVILALQSGISVPWSFVILLISPEIINVVIGFMLLRGRDTVAAPES